MCVFAYAPYVCLCACVCVKRCVCIYVSIFHVCVGDANYAGIGACRAAEEAVLTALLGLGVLKGGTAKELREKELGGRFQID